MGEAGRASRHTRADAGGTAARSAGGCAPGSDLVDLTFWAVDGAATPGAVAPHLLAVGWPAYRRWYLRDGEEPRPSYLECRHAVATHLPELLGAYDELVDACGGGDLEARFLSHWCPPPLFAACSLAAYVSGPRVLLRTYDYPPVLCDRTALRTGWLGTDVLAMADCVWGALDGVNEHGLATAIAFGGRPAVGAGFGIGLVVRYVLQVCRDVPEALKVLARVPVQLSYNVALVDRTGRAVVARVGPDRPMSVAPTLTAGNRQGATEWPEHAVFCGTEARERVLAQAAQRTGTALAALTDVFDRPPVYRPPAQFAWGTVYTAAYDVQACTLDLRWPGDSWHLPLAGFTGGVHPRSGCVAPPPTKHIAPHEVAHGRPLLIA